MGTARAEGFSHLQSFAHSLSPVALLDTVFPRFFGDVHTFSDVGYWGQPFFPSGYPYLLSLYLGPGISGSPRGRVRCPPAGASSAWACWACSWPSGPTAPSSGS